jgi:hypothetical protein
MQLRSRAILKSPLMPGMEVTARDVAESIDAAAPELFSATMIAFLFSMAAHFLPFFLLPAKPILPTAAAAQVQVHLALCRVLSPRNRVCSMALLCNFMPTSLVFPFRSFCFFAPSLQHALRARCLLRAAFVVNML